MDDRLKQKLKAFREEWSKRQALRVKIQPGDSALDKAEAQRSQDTLNDQKQLFYKIFNEEDHAQIEEYFFDELGPQIIEKEPTALDPSHPERIRELDAEVMNEYYFLREFFPER